MSTLALAAQRALAEDGFDHTPYCGHQIGVTVNELPRLLSYETALIEAGIVFTVEPGVYGDPEAGIGTLTGRYGWDGWPRVSP